MREQWCPRREPGRDVEHHDRARAASELEAARLRWDALGLESYTFDYSPECLCPYASQAPWRVTVTEGRVSDVTLVDGQPLPDFRAAPAVDQLFADLERAGREATGPVTVTFDPQSGVPVKGRIDWTKDAVDDEIGWRVTLVTPAVTTTSGDS